MSKLRAFTMPKWGIEMVEGTIAEWMVAEGGQFAKGDVLTLIETDKITNEVEAEFPGTLARIFAQTGQTYPVGGLLAVFAEGDADAVAIDHFISQLTGAPTRSGNKTEAVAPTAAAPPAPVPSAPANLPISPVARAEAERRGIDPSVIAGSGRNGRINFQDIDQARKSPTPAPSGQPVPIAVTTASLDKYFASPLAKRLALQNGVDLGDVVGTGPRGRISKHDVMGCVPTVADLAPEAAPGIVPSPQARTPVPGAGVEVVPMSAMRKAIARQLTLSKSTIPHFYLRNSVRIDALLAMRTQAKRATGDAPSINDYLIRACALALKAHPDINVQVHGDKIHRYPHADIAVAVATEKGLFTPIVQAAETLSVAAVSSTVKALAERARAGKLQPHEFQGGSFSISNLGMFGIDQFDAIINPPQGAILAVGAGRQNALGIDHALTFATRIQLSLSCDHRAIDGAVGARFLADLTTLIEAPEELTR